MNNLTNWVESTGRMDEGSPEALSKATDQLALDVDGGNSQAVEECRFLLLVPKNIPSVPLLITMSLIIYGMWKIKQKPSKFITNLGLRRDRSSLKAKKLFPRFRSRQPEKNLRLDCGWFSCLSNQKGGEREEN